MNHIKWSRTAHSKSYNQLHVDIYAYVHILVHVIVPKSPTWLDINLIVQK